MYRNSMKVHFNNVDMRQRWRILLIAAIFFLCLSIVLGVAVTKNSVYRKRAETQFRSQMLSAVSSAVDEVNRLSSTVASNTTARLSKVRQYVYHMEQLNQLSINLSGGEGGRLAPDEAFTVLYSDLETYESKTQAATSSAMDVRTLLLSHLTTLQALLEPR